MEHGVRMTDAVAFTVLVLAGEVFIIPTKLANLNNRLYRQSPTVEVCTCATIPFALLCHASKRAYKFCPVSQPKRLGGGHGHRLVILRPLRNMTTSGTGPSL